MKSDKEKTIFELPIYSMPEAEFNRRWNKFKEDCTRNLRDEDKKQNLEAFHQIYFPEYVWRYNQIVGFVEITVSKHDVYFHIHQSMDKRYVARSRTKHFICDLHNVGFHFPVINKDNLQIHKEIDEWLTSIQKDLPGNLQINRYVYNNVFEYLDIVQIIEDMK